jgi:hypothetical protein
MIAISMGEGVLNANIELVCISSANALFRILENLYLFYDTLLNQYRGGDNSEFIITSE